jgi:hypothetical protein
MATARETYERLIRGARDTLASIEDLLTAAEDRDRPGADGIRAVRRANSKLYDVEDELLHVFGEPHENPDDDDDDDDEEEEED